MTTSQVTVVPFYDRTGLIYETLGTLNTALTEEILVTIIVILVSVLHLRSSMLISALLPLAVLMCFIAMKTFGVDANIMSLAGRPDQVVPVRDGTWGALKRRYSR